MQRVANTAVTYRHEQQTLTLLTALLVGGWLWWLGQPAFPLDDAWIVTHAAEHWLGRVPGQFVGAAPLAGATSVVHVTLVAALGLLMPVPVAQLVLAGLATWALVLGLHKLAAVLGLERTWRLALPLLGLLAAETLGQLTNGLETGLAMAAVAWLLVVVVQNQPPSRVLLLGLGTLPFVRPELAALSGLLTLQLLWRAPRTWRVLADCLVWLGLGAAPWLAILWWQTGGVMAGTAGAKAAFFAESCWPLADRWHRWLGSVWAFVRQLGPLAIGLVGLLVGLGRLWPFVGFALLFGLAFLPTLPSGLYHNHFRYAHILLPVVLAGVAVLAARLPRRDWSRALPWLFMAAAALPVPGVLKRYAGDVAFDRTELTPVGQWLAAGVPAEATVLVHDAGRIATLARQPLVDLVGLKTPWVVPLHRKALAGRCPGHAGAALPQIASQSRARYLVLLEQWDQLHHLQDTLREAGWQLQRVDGERGETAYRVYALTPPVR